jgi:hypothetical protein
MPVIACPGCGKQYKLPANAAGQVAKCACGKRFRLGGAPAQSAAHSATASPKINSQKPVPKSALANKVATAVTAAPSVATPDDDFWNDALQAESAAKALPAKPASASGIKSDTVTSSGLSATVARPIPKPPAETKKPKKKKERIRWGFDWGKVAAGSATFLICGGLAVLLVMGTGRVRRGTIILGIAAMGGLFTAINGLMGEEGIW